MKDELKLFEGFVTTCQRDGEGCGESQVEVEVRTGAPLISSDRDHGQGVQETEGGRGRERARLETSE